MLLSPDLNHYYRYHTLISHDYFKVVFEKESSILSKIYRYNGFEEDKTAISNRIYHVVFNSLKGSESNQSSSENLFDIEFFHEKIDTLFFSISARLLIKKIANICFNQLFEKPVQAIVLDRASTRLKRGSSLEAKKIAADNLSSKKNKRNRNLCEEFELDRPLKKTRRLR